MVHVAFRSQHRLRESFSHCWFSGYLRSYGMNSWSMVIDKIPLLRIRTAVSLVSCQRSRRTTVATPSLVYATSDICVCYGCTYIWGKIVIILYIARWDESENHLWRNASWRVSNQVTRVTLLPEDFRNPDPIINPVDDLGTYMSLSLRSRLSSPNHFLHYLTTPTWSSKSSRSCVPPGSSSPTMIWIHGARCRYSLAGRENTNLESSKTWGLSFSPSYGRWPLSRNLIPNLSSSLPT